MNTVFVQLPQLHFDRPTGGIHVAEGQGTSVAKLVGPVSELVAAIAVGVGLHAFHEPASDPEPWVRLEIPEILGEVGVPQAKRRLGHGRGLAP